jgi:hypothetical protein
MSLEERDSFEKRREAVRRSPLRPREREGEREGGRKRENADD